jgi:hypothetical protein
MGIFVPTYTKTTFSTTPGPPVKNVFTNVYLSTRFESPIMQHNFDGTYTVQGMFKVFATQNEQFCIDRVPFNFTLSKDELGQSEMALHDIIFKFLKSQYPGATDSL